MNPNYRQNNQVQGRNMMNQQPEQPQANQGVMFSSPVTHSLQIGNTNMQNIQLNQNQYQQQNIPAQRTSHQSNQSAPLSVQSQDQQMMHMFNNMMGFLIERGVVDPKQLNQMTPRSKYNIEQLYRQEQQNYFLQQMHSINDFYQQLNTQNNYDPQDYQQYQKRAVNQQQISNRYPQASQQQPYLQSGQKMMGQNYANDLNFYMKNLQSPSSSKNQSIYQQQQYQQFQGMNVLNQSLDNVSGISGDYNQYNQIPNPMNYNNINGPNMQQQPQFYGNISNLSELQQQQLYQQNLVGNIRNGSPPQNSNNIAQNQNYYQNRGQIGERRDKLEDSNYNGQRVNTNPSQIQENDEFDRSQIKMQQQMYQQELLQQIQQHQQQQQKQRRLLDYDEIFNLSSNQGDSLANTQNLRTEYDNQFINTKYHQENVENVKVSQQRQGQVMKDYDELPISSMGATRNFEELIEEEMKKNNLNYEQRQSLEQGKLQKKRGDTPQFREGSVGTSQKRNKTESPQRFLKQGEGKGGRTTSVVPKDKQNKKQSLKKTKQDSIDESVQFQKFEEILEEISMKKTDISTDDILKIQKEEADLIEVRGEKVRLDNIEINEQLERLLVTKYVNNRIDDLNFYIEKFKTNYQKARVFKQNYEENIKKFDLLKSNFEERMNREKNDFEDYKAEQKKLIEAEYRLLKKLQQEKLTQSAAQQKSKEASAEREEDNTMKSLNRYKEEVKCLRDKLGRLQFDSKKKIEDLQLSLNNTIKENRKLRKECNTQKKQLEQCEDLKYIVNPAIMIREDPQEDQDKSSNERDQSKEQLNNEQEIIKKIPEKPKGIPRNEKDAKKLRQRQVSPPAHNLPLKKISEIREESVEAKEEENKQEDKKKIEQKQTLTSRQSEGASKKTNSQLSENLKDQTSKLKSLINPKQSNYKTSKSAEEQPPKQQIQPTPTSVNESQETKKAIPRAKPVSGIKNGAATKQANTNGQTTILQSQQQPSHQDSTSTSNTNNNSNSNIKPIEKPIKKTTLAHYQSLPKFTIEEIGKNVEISELKYSTNQHYIKYKQFNELNHKAHHVVNNQDGSVTSTYEKGIKETVHKNKTKQISFTNGYQIIVFPTGDVKQLFPNGIEQYYFSSNKATQTTLLEGQTVVIFSNNQIELTLADGSKQVRYPEGMMKISEVNGEEKIIYPNGIIETLDEQKVKTIKYQDGSTKTVYPDNFVVQDEFVNQK